MSPMPLLGTNRGVSVRILSLSVDISGQVFTVVSNEMHRDVITESIVN